MLKRLNVIYVSININVGGVGGGSSLTKLILTITIISNYTNDEVNFLENVVIKK